MVKHFTLTQWKVKTFLTCRHKDTQRNSTLVAMLSFTQQRTDYLYCIYRDYQKIIKPNSQSVLSPMKNKIHNWKRNQNKTQNQWKIKKKRNTKSHKVLLLLGIHSGSQEKNRPAVKCILPGDPTEPLSGTSNIWEKCFKG